MPAALLYPLFFAALAEIAGCFAGLGVWRGGVAAVAVRAAISGGICSGC